MTYNLTMSVAETVSRINPAMTFVYVSGQGTDSTENGRTMWGRVKGRTENALMRLPFKAADMFRPGIIMPLHGVQSKTALYRLAYRFIAPVYPMVKKLAPDAARARLGPPSGSRQQRRRDRIADEAAVSHG